MTVEFICVAFILNIYFTDFDEISNCSWRFKGMFRKWFDLYLKIYQVLYPMRNR